MIACDDCKHLITMKLADEFYGDQMFCALTDIVPGVDVVAECSAWQRKKLDK